MYQMSSIRQLFLTFWGFKKVFKNHIEVALRDVVSGHGGDGLIIGLDGLRGLGNLNDSMIWKSKSFL